MGKSLNGKELGVGITQRKDGSYQGRFTNRFGKRQTIYDKTLNGIRKKMREAQYEDEKAINVVSTNMILDEWFEVWINVHKVHCKESTKDTYRTVYNNLQKDLGWRKISSLNLDVIQLAINNLQTDDSKKFAKGLLSDILNTAVDCELILRNYASKVKIPNIEKKERRVLTIDETKIFLNKTKDDWYYDLYVFLLETGVRIGEAGALQWNDVDFKNNLIHIKHTLIYRKENGKYHYTLQSPKTKTSNRYIPLTQKSLQALKNQQKKCKEKNSSLVFFTKNMTPIFRSNIITRIQKEIIGINNEGVKFEKITPHTFRHTFATRAIENGMNPKVLQKILGHSTLQMTMDLYCHVTDDSLFAEIRKMENNVKINGVKVV